MLKNGRTKDKSHMDIMIPIFTSVFQNPILVIFSLCRWYRRKQYHSIRLFFPCQEQLNTNIFNKFNKIVGFKVLTSLVGPIIKLFDTTEQWQATTRLNKLFQTMMHHCQMTSDPSCSRAKSSSSAFCFWGLIFPPWCCYVSVELACKWP